MNKEIITQEKKRSADLDGTQVHGDFDNGRVEEETERVVIERGEEGRRLWQLHEL